MIYLAPEHDIRNAKILPCENHRTEFGITHFFNVITTDDRLIGTVIDNDSHTVFKFDMTNNDDDVISFQVLFNLIYCPVTNIVVGL